VKKSDKRPLRSVLASAPAPTAATNVSALASQRGGEDASALKSASASIRVERASALNKSSARRVMEKRSAELRVSGLSAAARIAEFDPTIGIPTTRQRLIEAAGEAFAQKGFRNVTVREICARAGANVAAINYHFGDKNGLYAAVIDYSLELGRLQYPIDNNTTADPSAQLRNFITQLLSKMLDDGRPSWHGRLMTREMVEPTHALESLVKFAIHPNYSVLVGIVTELLNETQINFQAEVPMSVSRDAVIEGIDTPAASAVKGLSFEHVPERVRRVCNSIIGQCLMYKHCEPVIRILSLSPLAAVRVQPQSRRHTAERHAIVISLAEHIAAFSLAAIRGLRRELEEQALGESRSIGTAHPPQAMMGAVR